MFGIHSTIVLSETVPQDGRVTESTQLAT